MDEIRQVNLDLGSIASKLGVGIRRVAAFMAIGINAARSVTAESLVLDRTETNFRFFRDEIDSKEVTEAAYEFRAWIQTNGLRELCTFLEHYLADMYICAAWLQLSDGGKVSSAATVPTLPKDFVRKGVTKKLELLEKEFGLTAPNSHFLATFWDARNCLTHRLGFVGREDLPEGGDALVVRWLGFEMWIKLEGEEPRLLPLDLGEGIYAPNGGAVEVRVVERKKEFRLGERINLDAHELSEILVSAQQQCGALMQGVIKIAETKGITSPPPTDKPEQVGTKTS